MMVFALRKDFVDAASVIELPDSWWCPSLGPMAPNKMPWRCVLDAEHSGVHRSAGDPTWLTEQETGRATPNDSES
jgi:hypothetical protein